MSGAVVMAFRCPGVTPGPRAMRGMRLISLYSGDHCTVSSHDSDSHDGRFESSLTFASGSCTHSALPK